MALTSSKRIPDPLEAAVAEVIFVDGGEVGDALLDEEKCGPPIVGAAAGEVGFAEFRPEGVMEVPAVRREADDLPTGVSPYVTMSLLVWLQQTFIRWSKEDDSEKNKEWINGLVNAFEDAIAGKV